MAIPLFVPFTNATPASEGWFVETLFVPTMLSYCSYTHLLDAIFG